MVMTSSMLHEERYSCLVLKLLLKNAQGEHNEVGWNINAYCILNTYFFVIIVVESDYSGAKQGPARSITRWVQSNSSGIVHCF